MRSYSIKTRKIVLSLIALSLAAGNCFADLANHSSYQGGVDRASDVRSDTTNFNHNLSASDNTVQKALDTLDDMSGGGGSGTVTSVSVTTANGVSGVVATATTTPAITLSLGAITPTTVNGVTFSGSSTPTLAVTGTTTVSGANTGDQTLSSLAAAPSNASYVTTASESGLSAETVVSKVASAYTRIPVQEAKLPSTNPARIDASGQCFMLLFDPTTSQSAIWSFVMPQDYGSGLTVRILFTMASTQSGTNTVTFDAYIQKDTEGDAEDVDTSGFAAANAATETLLNNQTAGYVRSLTITCTNADSVAAGDFVQLKIDRDIADTASGDAEIRGILVEYTKA